MRKVFFWLIKVHYFLECSNSLKKKSDFLKKNPLKISIIFVFGISINHKNLNSKTSFLLILPMKIKISFFLFATIFFHLLLFNNAYYYDDNCNMTNGLGNCTLCNSGFRLDSSGHCTCGVSNCDNCSADSSNNSICLSCSRYFGLQDSDSTSCKSCYLDDCSNCSLNSQGFPYCLNCTEGYLLQNNKCVNCSDAIPGCDTCLMNGTCAICDDGYGNRSNYYFNGTKCVKCGSDEKTKNCRYCGNHYFKAYGYYDEGCFICQDGYGIINGICQNCSSYDPNCRSCDSNRCKFCYQGYELLNASTATTNSTRCVACIDPNCSECRSDDSCSYCKSGYFRTDSLYNSSCSLCSEAGIIRNNCLKPECYQYAASSPIDQYCSECKFGFFDFLGVNKDHVCVNCSEARSNCLQCEIYYTVNGQDISCTQCKEGYYLRLEQDDTWTCTQNCNATHLPYFSNNSCISCQFFYGNFCGSCNNTHCLSCNSSLVYLLTISESKESCSDCTNTDFESLLNLNNKTYCSRKTKPILSNFTRSNNSPSLNVSCGVNPSRILFVYGPKVYTQNFNLLNDVLVKVGSKNVTNVPSTADTQWVGFGSRKQNSSNSFFVRLIPPLKNSGEVYQMNIWCINLLNKSDASSTTKEWTQPDNGGKTTKISFISNTKLSSSEKKALGYAVKKSLKVNREMYTDDGELVPSKIFTMGISAAKDNTTNYTTTFTILPDYTVSNDDSATFINQTLQNSSSFLQSVASILTTLNMEKTIQVSSFASTSASTYSQDPILSNVNLIQNGNSLTINFNLTNTNGTFFAGVEPTIYGLKYSNLSDSNLNLRYPIWNLFIQGLNYSSATLTKFVNVTAKSAVASSITVSNLESNKTYLVYYGAINDGIPPSHTYLYINVTNMIISSDDSFSMRNYVWSFLLLVIFCILN